VIQEKMGGQYANAFALFPCWLFVEKFTVWTLCKLFTKFRFYLQLLHLTENILI
jgi:hypothetical protein